MSCEFSEENTSYIKNSQKTIMIFPLKDTISPRWVVLTTDITICLFSIILAYFLRFNFAIPAKDIDLMKYSIPVVILVRLLSFIIFRTYADILKYTSTKDATRVIIVVIGGSVLFGIINFITFHFISGVYLIPFSIIIIDFFVTTVLLIGFRVLVKLTYMELRSPRKEKTEVVIFGAGESGVITKRTLDRDTNLKYKAVAFLDDDADISGKKLEGTPIYHSSHIEEILANNNISDLIIAVQNISSDRKQEITNLAIQFNVNVLVVPPVSNWINGELSFKQIKHIKIEDLLERDVINLDNKKISDFLHNKIVLVTGAAGSIGSEIVRQSMQFLPKSVICYDQSETGLFELEMELSMLPEFSRVKIIIGDINDTNKLNKIFSSQKPEIIFHSAAYKHVPLMEYQVSEAVKNNVIGTQNVANIAIENNAEKFIMISTDKAVNPTSIMGASKRLAEIYTQTLSDKHNTKFITTRFGNVLGSNGSVIPVFKKQIEKGGPLTVTHPEVKRYFMTIKEACQLVLEASVMGKGGEIFIFDMGKSVKIVDLAKKMIKLSGLELGKDISIQFTGLRPGEKLYEELFNCDESTIPTYHSRILIAKVREYKWEEIKPVFDEIEHLCREENDDEIVKLMKKTIPEYKSQSSVFSKYDN